MGPKSCCLPTSNFIRKKKSTKCNGWILCMYVAVWKFHLSQPPNQHGTIWAVMSMAEWADCFWECTKSETIVHSKNFFKSPSRKLNYWVFFLFPVWVARYLTHRKSLSWILNFHSLNMQNKDFTRSSKLWIGNLLIDSMIITESVAMEP